MNDASHVTMIVRRGSSRSERNYFLPSPHKHSAIITFVHLQQRTQTHPGVLSEGDNNTHLFHDEIFMQICITVCGVDMHFYSLVVLD